MFYLIKLLPRTVETTPRMTFRCNGKNGYIELDRFLRVSITRRVLETHHKKKVQQAYIKFYKLERLIDY